MRVLGPQLTALWENDANQHRAESDRQWQVTFSSAMEIRDRPLQRLSHQRSSVGRVILHACESRLRWGMSAEVLDVPLDWTRSVKRGRAPPWMRPGCPNLPFALMTAQVMSA